jgi:hypothetical protein
MVQSTHVRPIEQHSPEPALTQVTTSRQRARLADAVKARGQPHLVVPTSSARLPRNFRARARDMRNFR